MQVEKNNIRKGITWTAIDRFSSQIVLFIVSIIVARLVTPAEYGILGIIMVFVNVSGVIIDSGLGNALIYYNTIQKKELNTAFSFNLIVGVIIFGLIYISAPFIEDFYKLTNLSLYLRITILVIIFNSLIVVPTALLKVNLNFRAIAISNVASNITSGAIAIWLAYSGYGIWALIIQVLSRSFFHLVIIYIQCRWIPAVYFGKDIFLRLYKYSINIFSASCLTKITEEGLSFFIGKHFTPYTLGIYTRSIQFAALPSVSIGNIIISVLFPSLSKIKDDDIRFRKLYDITIETLAMFSIPLFIGLIVIANPLVRLILTDKWIDVVLILQVLCVGRILFPLSNVTEQVLNSKGRSDLFLKQQIIKMISKLILVFPALFCGIFWVSIADSFSNLTAYFITNIIAKNCFDPGIKDQLKKISTYLISNIVIGIIVYITIMNMINPLLQVLIALFLYISLYVVFLSFVKKDFILYIINK